MKNNRRLMAVGLAVVCGCAVTGLAGPLIGDVRMVPRANSRTVDIYYKLTGADAYITLAIETNALVAPGWQGVKIPDGRVTRLGGDVASVITVDAANDKHIVWNAGEDWPEVEIDEARAVVTAWATDYPPTYLVFDLGGESATNGEHFAQHRVSARGYPSAAALPHGGVSNDIYRSSLLVMRRIESGAFVMGSPDNELGRYANEHLHQVTISHAFYLGIFTLTKAQWRRIKSAGPTDVPYNPAENESYGNLRGGTWPAPDDAIAPASFIGTLRSRCTPAFEFDLPTEAQWEYACRAGTQTALHNGKDLTSTTVACPNRAEIAWVAFNSAQKIHRVGEKRPNAWGLYDMIGNVNEVVRDRYSEGLGNASVVDPVGPESGTDRIRKGGNAFGQRDPRAAFRSRYLNAESSVGFRLALRPLAGIPEQPQE